MLKEEMLQQKEEKNKSTSNDIRNPVLVQPRRDFFLVFDNESLNKEGVIRFNHKVVSAVAKL